MTEAEIVFARSPIAGCSEFPGGFPGELSRNDFRGHKTAEEVADEQTDDSFFHFLDPSWEL